jgi:hypothetical protein
MPVTNMSLLLIMINQGDEIHHSDCEVIITTSHIHCEELYSRLIAQ